MTVTKVQSDLNIAYSNIEKAIADGNRAAIKYEILMSEEEYSRNEGTIMGDIDNYILKIQNEANQNSKKTFTLVV